MSKKSDAVYFDTLNAAADESCRAAEFLCERLVDFSGAVVSEDLVTMHGFETTGDEAKHRLSAALAKAFVTPLEREDLASLSHAIDDVTDALEEVLQEFYVDHVTDMLPHLPPFAQMVRDCCEKMRQMLRSLPEYKHPARLREQIVEVGKAEEACDAYYLEGIWQLWTTVRETRDLISWRRIYDRLEACADACEHVADAVEVIVMKNT